MQKEISTIELWLIMLLAGIVYFLSMFLDLMGPDAVQYAQISLDMAKSHEFLEVQYLGADYLDKPPLLFWVNSLLFSLTGFSNVLYHIPSFLVALLGLYSTWRLAGRLYDRQVAWHAVLILMTTIAFFLLVMDVRTDTMLLGFVVFSVWQWRCWFDESRWINLLLGSAGIGLALLTKGPIGLMVPLLAFLPDMLYRRYLKKLLDPRLLAGVVLILLLLLPMLAGLYSQHGWTGVKFFFWTQSFGRLTGENVWDNNASYFFLSHNFLWSFLPWTIPAMVALVTKFIMLWQQRNHLQGKEEIITLAGFSLPFVALSFSHYQLPHYMYVVFPFMAIMTSRILQRLGTSPGPLILTLFTVQLLVLFLMVGAMSAVMLWVFPTGHLLLWGAWLVLIGLAFWSLFGMGQPWVKMIRASALTGIALGLVMMTHFYPNLLRFQAGAMIAHEIKRENIPPQQVSFFNIAEVTMYLYAGVTSPIYKNPVEMTDIINSGDRHWVVTNEAGLTELSSMIPPVSVDTFYNHSITMISPRFLSPQTRYQVSEKWFLAEFSASR